MSARQNEEESTERKKRKQNTSKNGNKIPQKPETEYHKKRKRLLALGAEKRYNTRQLFEEMEMTDYIKRVVDAELADQLESSGAVLVVGPKWCGKTTSAMQQAKSVIKLQDVKLRSAYLQIADTDPTRLLEGAPPAAH